MRGILRGMANNKITATLASAGIGFMAGLVGGACDTARHGYFAHEESVATGLAWTAFKAGVGAIAGGAFGAVTSWGAQAIPPQETDGNIQEALPAAPPHKFGIAEIAAAGAALGLAVGLIVGALETAEQSYYNNSSTAGEGVAQTFLWGGGGLVVGTSVSLLAKGVHAFFEPKAVENTDLTKPLIQPT